MYPFVSFVYILAALSALFVNCAESMTSPTQDTNSQVCSADAKISMSQGFITAAMSAMSPLGVGSCTDNVCSSTLAPCPNTTCCLSNQSGSSCGCLKKNALGTTTCVDPKLLSVDIAGCDPETGASHEVRMELYSGNPDAPCNSVSVGNLVVNEEGKLYLEISARSCIGTQTRDEPRKNTVYLVGPDTVELDLTVTVLPQGVKTLYTLLGKEQVENLISYHKSILQPE